MTVFGREAVEPPVGQLQGTNACGAEGPPTASGLLLVRVSGCVAPLLCGVLPRPVENVAVDLRDLVE